MQTMERVIVKQPNFSQLDSSKCCSYKRLEKAEIKKMKSFASLDRKEFKKNFANNHGQKMRISQRSYEAQRENLQ